MSGEDQCRHSRGSSGGASLAHPDMVHSSPANVSSETQSNGVDVRTGTINAPLRQQGSQHARETEVDGMSLVWRQYENKGIPGHIACVLLDSWRTSTQKQYAVHLKRWHVFCSEREIAPYSPAVTDILEFLYSQLHLSYASLNTARSALSCIISLDAVPAGQHPLVARFLKGAFERKPPPSRPFEIWDVQTVLNFLKTFSPNSSLSLKDLALKLTTLLALITIQRKQTLVRLKISAPCMSKSDSRFIFTLDSHIKQRRPAYTVPPVVVPKYVIDTNICPYDCLEHYLFKTEPIRTEDYLLLSFIKPHKAVGTQTVGRWIKSILSGAGIDITAFKPHSTRHAASTAAFDANVPIDDILKRAGWSNAATFRDYYYKRVII